jgi:hypothetical protein
MLYPELCPVAHDGRFEVSNGTNPLAMSFAYATVQQMMHPINRNVCDHASRQDMTDFRPSFLQASLFDKSVREEHPLA